MERYSHCFKNKSFVYALVLAFLMLAFSLLVNRYAGVYATQKASNPVNDIILDNIRVYDIDGLFIYGPVMFLIFLAVILLAHPHRIPFTIKSISLFVVIRSLFITLTHLGVSPEHSFISPTSLMNYFSPGSDLFFSGHAGLPFLLALIFWEKPVFRFIFMLFSIFLGAVVLMGHLHYSIDVLASFFIVYSIFRLGEIFFKKDLRIFNSKGAFYF